MEKGGLIILQTLTVEKATFNYFKIWSLVLPITSFLLIPSIQGTTPGYVLGFLSLLIGLFSEKYKINLLSFFYFYFMFEAIVLLINLYSDFTINAKYLGLMTNPGGSLNITLITQSLYFIPAILLFYFTKNFYQSSWNKYIFRGILLLASYGIYEFIYWYLFKSNGDFVSNRVFDGDHPGSWLQTTTFLGQSLARIKSLTGEPSMFAFTVLPFFMMSMHYKKTWASVVLLFTLFFSFSTTAYLGVATYFAIRLFTTKPIKNKKIIISLYFLIFFFLLNVLFQVVDLTKLNVWFYNDVIMKLQGQDHSGGVRLNSFKDSLDLFLTMPFFSKIFGLGFGAIRTSSMYTTFLVNTGILGLLVFLAAFIYPTIILMKSKEDKWLSYTIIVLLVCMISVPEFAYLPTWLFLGMAYNKVNLLKKRRFLFLLKISLVVSNLLSRLCQLQYKLTTLLPLTDQHRREQSLLNR